VTGVDQRLVLAPDDGSLGPLLRVADDRLAPGAGYGRHAHRAVDVVAVLLAGSLRHRWGDGAALAPGDVAVLRAGGGLDHDEIAGEDGARVLQCYLRSAAPGAAPTYDVHRAASGWVELGRADARLWLSRVTPGQTAALPPGLLLEAGEGDVSVVRQDGGTFRAEEAVSVLVWQVDPARPSWAED
jgi:redox-sensitive bicupin YhaK (pirin superfamily)